MKSVIAYKIKSFAIIFCTVSLFGCLEVDKNFHHKNEINTVANFIKSCGTKNTKELKMFVRDKQSSFDEEGFTQSVQQIVTLKNKYFLSNPSDWIIEYDTNSSIVQYKKIIVLFHKSKTDKAVVAKSEFNFDNTKIYLPDTVISDFTTEVLSITN